VSSPRPTTASRSSAGRHSGRWRAVLCDPEDHPHLIDRLRPDRADHGHRGRRKPRASRRPAAHDPHSKAPTGGGGLRYGGPYWDRTSGLLRVREARYRCANGPLIAEIASPIRDRTRDRCALPNAAPLLTCCYSVIRATECHSVSGKRTPLGQSPVRGGYSRWRRDLNPCRRLCRPLPRLSATPPCGFQAFAKSREASAKARSLRADNRARTGDLNLGKVALYQLSYVRRNASDVTSRCACVQRLADPKDRSPTDCLVPARSSRIPSRR
jgi:hypothetical protein